MAQIEVVAIRVAFLCSECMGPVALNALAPRAHCSHCETELATRVQLEWLAKVFGFWGKPSSWKRNELQTNNTVNGMHSEGVRRFAACRACKAPLDGDAIAGASAASSHLACPKCPETLAVREADEVVHGILPGARFVLGEAPIGPAAAAPVQAVLVACLQCGAPLKVDGGQRILTCQYCESANFISDALWLRMHPAQKRQWIYLVQ